jgi:hypothetical protein
VDPVVAEEFGSPRAKIVDGRRRDQRAEVLGDAALSTGKPAGPGRRQPTHQNPETWCGSRIRARHHDYFPAGVA